MQATATGLNFFISNLKATMNELRRKSITTSADFALTLAADGTITLSWYPIAKSDHWPGVRPMVCSNSALVGNPGEAEHDAGVKLNSIPGRF
jgi:hypothetical protein